MSGKKADKYRLDFSETDYPRIVFASPSDYCKDPPPMDFDSARFCLVARCHSKAKYWLDLMKEAAEMHESYVR